MAKLIDGKMIAGKVMEEVAEGSRRLVAQYGEEARPNMTLVLVGSDPVSKKLVDLKANPKRYVHFSVFGKKDK